MTLKELSQKSGVSISAISDVEAYRIPLGEERAECLAHALEIKEDVLTIYRGKLPKYATRWYLTIPDEIEAAIQKAIAQFMNRHQEAVEKGTMKFCVGCTGYFKLEDMGNDRRCIHCLEAKELKLNEPDRGELCERAIKENIKKKQPEKTNDMETK